MGNRLFAAMAGVSCSCPTVRGLLNIWRSDLDGGNARRLTDGASEAAPSCSPDGAWLTYHSAEANKIGVWRMSTDGGAPERIWDRHGLSSISPDGKLVLVRESLVAEPKVRIIPATGGQPIRTFDLSDLGGGDPHRVGRRTAPRSCT